MLELITQFDRLVKGVVRRTPSEKPLQLLVVIVVHVLKDVAILPDMKVAEKTCQAFEHSDAAKPPHSPIGAGFWKADMKSKSMSSVSKAVKIEESAKVPAAKFAVYAGYAVQ